MDNNCAWYGMVRSTAVLRILVLYFLNVGESNGHPKNHPQCTVWIHSELHPWCRSEVSIIISFLHCYGENSGLYWMSFMPLNAARWMMSFCLTSLVFSRTSAPIRVWRRTLTWKCLQRCWKHTYPGLLKLTGDRSHFLSVFWNSKI